jgi:hypothetical protein
LPDRNPGRDDQQIAVSRAAKQRGQRVEIVQSAVSSNQLAPFFRISSIHLPILTMSDSNIKQKYEKPRYFSSS